MNQEIPVLFLNDDFVVVNKPTGISVHNAEGGKNLIELLALQLNRKTVWPVHRLDKETSGVQVLALSATAAQNLADRLHLASTKKLYRGILRGTLPVPQGVWNSPLTDKAEGRVNPAGAPRDRVPCETLFLTVRNSKYFTDCQFEILTGRQHQIRKHAALSKHPVVGDIRYGERNYNTKISSLYNLSRMFLHCCRLELGANVFEADLPSEFDTLMSGATIG